MIGQSPNKAAIENPTPPVLRTSQTGPIHFIERLYEFEAMRR
jgi:hypothetical protein